MEKEIKIVKKKRFYKKKLFYILLVVGLILVSVVYGKIKKANQPPTYETVQVERGVLSQTVDAAGNIESANELDLKFEALETALELHKKQTAEAQTKMNAKIGVLTLENKRLESTINMIFKAIQEAQDTP